MSEVSLQLYKTQERELAVQEARNGLRFHIAATVVVVVALVLVNVFVSSGFRWAIFPAVGMALGVWAHWYFGVRHGDELMRRHQDEIERKAQRPAA